MQYRPLQCRIVPVGWRMVTPYSTNAMNFVILLYFVSRTKVSLFIFLSTLRFFFHSTAGIICHPLFCPLCSTFVHLLPFPFLPCAGINPTAIKHTGKRVDRGRVGGIGGREGLRQKVVVVSRSHFLNDNLTVITSCLLRHRRGWDKRI